MQAALLKNGKFDIQDIKKPELDSKEGAIVKVKGCGLCGSDIVKLKTSSVKDGSVLGHEVVGEIVEIKTKTEFKVGDEIAMGHHIPCFNCTYCYSGHYSMCRHFKGTNILPGGFAQYIYVSEEHLNNTVFKIPDSLSLIESSFLEPLACCIRAVKRAGLSDNTKNLILGLGSIGILMGEAVKAFGNEAYGCDIKKDRVLLSEDYGFDKSFIMTDEDKVLSDMKKYAPIGFDNIFLTAGSSGVIDFAIKSARDGANIIVFSSVKDDKGFKNNDIYYRELTILGSYSPSPVDLEDSMNLLKEGKVNVKEISTVYTLDKLNQALEDTISNKIMKAYIKI